MYIEFVIADNFVLTLLSGMLAAGFSHARTNIFRQLAAAALGTVAAVFYPFLKVNVFASTAIKLALWAVLSIVLFFKTKRPIVSALMFLGCTFALGGASYALGIMVFQDSVKAEAFSKRCPLFIVLAAGVMVWFFARLCLRRLRVIRARAPYEYGAEVEVFGEKLWFEAFLDTGNSVIDALTGLPVMITDTEKFTAKLRGASAAEFVKNADRFRKMKVHTPAGDTTAYLIKPKCVTVYSASDKHTINAMVGLVAVSGSHEMLIGPAVVAEAL